MIVFAMTIINWTTKENFGKKINTFIEKNKTKDCSKYHTQMKKKTFEFEKVTDVLTR